MYQPVVPSQSLAYATSLQAVTLFQFFLSCNPLLLLCLEYCALLLLPSLLWLLFLKILHALSSFLYFNRSQVTFVIFPLLLILVVIHHCLECSVTVCCLWNKAQTSKEEFKTFLKWHNQSFQPYLPKQDFLLYLNYFLPFPTYCLSFPISTWTTLPTIHFFMWQSYQILCFIIHLTFPLTSFLISHACTLF